MFSFALQYESNFNFVKFCNMSGCKFLTDVSAKNGTLVFRNFLPNGKVIFVFLNFLQFCCPVDRCYPMPYVDKATPSGKNATCWNAVNQYFFHHSMRWVGNVMLLARPTNHHL